MNSKSNIPERYLSVLKRYRALFWLSLSCKRIMNISIYLLVVITCGYAAIQAGNIEFTRVGLIILIGTSVLCVVILNRSKPTLRDAAWHADASLGHNCSLFTTALYADTQRISSVYAKKVLAKAGTIRIEELSLPAICKISRLQNVSLILAITFTIIGFGIFKIPNPFASLKTNTAYHDKNTLYGHDNFLEQIDEFKKQVVLSKNIYEKSENEIRENGANSPNSVLAKETNEQRVYSDKDDSAVSSEPPGRLTTQQSTNSHEKPRLNLKSATNKSNTTASSTQVYSESYNNMSNNEAVNSSTKEKHRTHTYSDTGATIKIKSINNNSQTYDQTSENYIQIKPQIDEKMKAHVIHLSILGTNTAVSTQISISPSERKYLTKYYDYLANITF